MSKFKKKYILGTGYPISSGAVTCDKVGLSKNLMEFDRVALIFPDELYAQETPKYRLVLERVDSKRKTK